MYFGHFPDDRQKLTNPHIDLFTDRRVEDPLAVVIQQLGEPGRVAVVLAVSVLSTVLLDGVKYIHGKTHSKEMVILDVVQVGAQLAVVIEEQEGWERSREVSGKRGVDEQL